MDKLIAITGIVIAGAITPGPNNFVVMRAGARAGLRGALPAVAGVVVGTLILLGVVMAGAGAAFATLPQLRTVITAGGCLYLSSLGARLIAASFGASALRETSALESGFFALLGLQFFNPKAWVMVLTAAAATTAFAPLALLFTAVPAICLLLWASLGSMLSESLQRRHIRAWFDRAMGGLLFASAALLFLET